MNASNPKDQTADYTLGGLMPHVFHASCLTCGEPQIVSSDSPVVPEPEVCDRCHNGIMHWERAA